MQGDQRMSIDYRLAIYRSQCVCEKNNTEFNKREMM